MNEAPALEVSALFAAMVGSNVVRDVGFAWGQGEAVGLLGPNAPARPRFLRGDHGL